MEKDREQVIWRGRCRATEKGGETIKERERVLLSSFARAARANQSCPLEVYAKCVCVCGCMRVCARALLCVFSWGREGCPVTVTQSFLPQYMHTHACTHSHAHICCCCLLLKCFEWTHSQRKTLLNTKKTHLYSHIIIITAKNKTGRGTKGCVFSVVCMSASLCVYSLWPQVKAHAASFQRKVGVCVRRERMRGVEPRGGAIDFCLAHTLTSEYTHSH